MGKAPYPRGGVVLQSAVDGELGLVGGAEAALRKARESEQPLVRTGENGIIMKNDHKITCTTQKTPDKRSHNT